MDLSALTPAYGGAGRQDSKWLAYLQSRTQNNAQGDMRPDGEAEVYFGEDIGEMVGNEVSSGRTSLEGKASPKSAEVAYGSKRLSGG